MFFKCLKKVSKQGYLCIFKMSKSKFNKNFSTAAILCVLIILVVIYIAILWDSIYRK